MKRIFLLSFAVLAASQVLAQTKPFITNIDKTSAAPGDEVVISGINFPAQADIRVTFGSGIGTVTSATANLIEVTVPATATFGAVSVTNTTNGLIGYSSELFTPSFGGSTFNEAAISAPVKFDPSQNGMYDLCVCDFDGDGKNDAATSQNVTEATRVPVFHNIGDINTTDFANITSTTLTIDVATFNVTCGDLDGDGKPELVANRALAGSTPGDIIFVFRNTSTAGNISFAAPLLLTLPTDAAGLRKNVARMAIMDMDGDGKPEITATNEIDNRVDVFKNTSTVGSINFEATSYSFPIAGSRSFGLDVKDLNNDGFPEIIVNALQQQNVYVLPNTSNSGTISFGSSITLTIALQLANLVVGDLNGDGLNDIAATQPFANQISVILNQSSGVGGSITFGTASTYAVSSSPWGIDLADLNGDGALDILVASQQSNNVTALVNGAGGTMNFTRFNLPAGEPTRNIKAADINQDGKPDILAAGITNSNLVVFANRNCIAPVITPANATICQGTDFILHATKSVGHTYTWESAATADGTYTTIGTNDSFLDLSDEGTGNLFIRVNIKSNETSPACNVTSSVTSQIVVAGTPPDAPVVTAPAPVCPGATLELDGTLADPADAKSYQWTGPNGFSSTDAVLSIPNFDASKAGVYSLRYVTQSDCLSPAAEVKVATYSLPAITVRYEGNGLFCEDATVALTAPAYGDDYTYEWNLDAQPVTGQATTNLTASTSGVYSVRLTDATTTCTTLSETLTLTRMAKPVTTFTSASLICVDVPMNFAATSTGATGLTLNYAWDFQNDGTTDQTTATFDQTYTTAGVVTASLTTGYDEIAGCTTTLTRDITVRAVPVVAIETPDGTEKCPESSVTLQVPAGYTSYAWSNAATTNSIVVPDPGTYTVTMVDDAQCTIVSSVDITNFDTSTSVTITSNDAVIEEGATTQFAVSGHTDILLWDPVRGLDDPTSATPVVTGEYESEDYPNLDANGQLPYTYTVTALDANGCEVTASINLAVIPEETPAPMKSFSPNGDGIGDFWEIDNAEFNQECKLVIYDRRGRAIIETRPYNNDWDGTLNGNALEQGVYYYVFICDDPARNNNGSILLFR